MYRCTAGSTAAIPLGPFVNTQGTPLAALALLNTHLWITSNGSKTVLGTTGATVATTDAQGVAFLPASYVTALLAAAGYFRIDVQATGALTYWEDVFVFGPRPSTPAPAPGTPAVIDWPAVQNNVAQTLRNLIALRLEIMATPKPSYSVHGHAYSWNEFYKMLSDQIDACMRQLSQLEPYEYVGAGR